jgi:hypothetical protein
MPYTLSHALISLPVSVVARGKIPLAALFVGSMSPDFPYLLALTTVYAPGHSLMGVLIYCLFPSLCILYFWYSWIEVPVLALIKLPQRAHNLTISAHFLIIIGVLIGAYSHVLWDASSHFDGIFVINNNFWHIEYLSLPLYKWNQYISGGVGLITLFVWYLYALVKNKESAYQGHLVAGFIVYLSCMTIFVVLANVIHHSLTLYDYAVRSSIGFIVGIAIGSCFYALTVKLCKAESSLRHEL